MALDPAYVTLATDNVYSSLTQRHTKDVLSSPPSRSMQHRTSCFRHPVNHFIQACFSQENRLYFVLLFMLKFYSLGLFMQKFFEPDISFKTP